MKKKKVAILFGGNTKEYLISCKSAKSILNNIDKDKYIIFPIGISKDNIWYLYEDNYDVLENWIDYKKTKIDNIISFLKNIDIVFPIIHGDICEDGKLQGLFDLFNIKYVGCDSLTNGVCYDKEYTKIILSKYNIPNAEYKVIHNKKEKIKLDFNYPVIVKPATSGSSIGIDIANNKKELSKCIDNAFEYSNKVIIEKFIKARELECAIILKNNKLIISTIGEIKYNSTFYDYNAKYVNDSQLIIPAKIDKDIINEIKKYIKIIVKVLNIKGLSRIDFLYDEVNNKVYLIEINTMPGFTDISMYPKLFSYDKIDYKDLISLLIDNVE